MKYFYTFLLVALSIAFFTRCDDNNNEEPEAQKPYLSIELDVLRLVNEHRQSFSLDTLTEVNAIKSSAQLHSRNMAIGAVQPLTHGDYEARMADIMNQLEISDRENVTYDELFAVGPTKAEQVVEAWLQSENKRATIEGNYNLTGVGVRQDATGTYYYTMIFMNATLPEK